MEDVMFVEGLIVSGLVALSALGILKEKMNLLSYPILFRTFQF